MAGSEHSLGRLKRERSPSASHSGRVHKRRIDDCDSPKSDVTPGGTTIDDLTASVRGIQLEGKPRAWRHKTAQGIRRDRPRKRPFNTDEESELD